VANRTFALEPKKVIPVKTAFRQIRTKIPTPQSVSILKKLRANEPISMTGQPPVLWDRAQGVNVYDRWGNKWLDWSSGVLVTNAGHGRKEIAQAIIKQAKSPLLHNFFFPNERRAELAAFLVKLAPAPLKKCFLLTTGAETIECALKLAKTYGVRNFSPKKNVIVSFQHAFHGRTMGAQLAGGIPGLKTWMTETYPDFVNVPFPGDPRNPRKSFADFESSLAEQNINPENVAGVITETYQGGSSAFLPVDFTKQLRAWCDKNKALLIFDEVQAGFGRCGTLFGFEHYGVVPDLACFGKGITSSLPLSCILGRADLLDLYGPGEMSSTHTGNPICSTAALTNLKIIVKEKLHKNAAKQGKILFAGIDAIVSRHRERVLAVNGKGLVAAIMCQKPGTAEPDHDFAFEVVERCVEKGLLMFAPVGFGGASIKICPPLISTAAQIQDGLKALGEAFDEIAASRT
jgi:4-aminobutyrate aminotransferase-like enzyme